MSRLNSIEIAAKEILHAFYVEGLPDSENRRLAATHVDMVLDILGTKPHSIWLMPLREYYMEVRRQIDIIKA